MAFEQYANLCTTNLTANYTAGSGVLQVLTTGAPWPTVGNFRVFVANPLTGVVKVILEITAVTDGTHWAVVSEGADANAITGDIVKLCLTAGSMNAIRGDLVQSGAAAAAVSNRNGNLYLPTDALQILRDNGSLFSAWGPIWPLTNPNLQTWVQQDFGSCTSDTSHGGIDISNPTVEAAFHIHALVFNAPATPYHVEFGYLQRKQNTGNSMTWPCFSDGTKYEILDPFFQNILFQTVVFYNSNSTTNAGTVANANPSGPAGSGAMVWARLGDDGVNKTWDLSIDGFNWWQVATEAHAANFVATKIGIYVDSGPAQIRLMHCKITT